MGASSSYYELALYKLGWTLYKQELYEEALHEYMALLDYKVSIGYDFEHATDEDGGRRIADTFRVVSLSFSNLGGPEVVGEYFAPTGNRGYEDRIYSHLGEFYLEKLPLPRRRDGLQGVRRAVSAPQVVAALQHARVEIYDEGDFPKLVLEAKKEFAASYGLQSEYWRHFDVASRRRCSATCAPT